MKKAYWLAIIIVLIILGAWLIYRASRPVIITPNQTATSTKTSDQSTDLITETQIEEMQTIVLDKTALFFTDADSSAPKLKIPTVDQATKTRLETTRQNLSSPLATKTLVELKSYLAELKTALNSLNPNNSGLSQTQLSNFQAVIASAENDLLVNNDTPPTPIPISFDKFGVPRLIEGANRY